MIEFKKDETQPLPDEELEGVSGGTEGYWVGSATGKTCTNCFYKGPHIARQYYDVVGNDYTLGRVEVFCGKCKQKIQ